MAAWHTARFASREGKGGGGAEHVKCKESNVYGMPCLDVQNSKALLLPSIKMMPTTWKTANCISSLFYY